MIHLLLWRVLTCGHARWMSSDEIKEAKEEEAEEELVMVLLKIIK